ncbi:helix-turn-helix domain-containing protein [Flagellimonas flava]|uniref:helix-turn-helix domain-containing protein n=1 Tax=Flagellimonas flava TaxID=570519 RepID=UPI003D656FAD
MNSIEYLFSLFAFLAVVLAILLFLKKKGNRYANRLLGIYVLLFGYNVFYNILYWSGKLYSLEFINLLFTNMLVWVLYGPILYFYVRKLVNGKSITIKDTVHFIPFILLLVNHFKVHWMAPETKLELFQNGIIVLSFIYFSPHTGKLIIALMVLYFILIWVKLRKSVVSHNQGIWLKWIAFSFLGYVASFTSFFVLSGLGVLQPAHDYIIGAAIIFFISMLAYFGFVQPEVFEGIPMKKIVPLIKYKTTGLTKDFSLELKEELSQLMKEHKPYLNSEYRLADLAEKLNISRHHCSQVINEHFDSNFFNFINQYRIEEAKKMLRQSDTQSISDVMFACGFNNRVSFYNAFKKFTGTTPKTFLDPDNKESA